MAKLSKEVLEEGRGHIRNSDLPGFMKWLVKHVPRYSINHEVVESTFEKIFKFSDTDKGLKMFEVGIANINPAADRGKRIVFVLGALAVAAFVIRDCSHRFGLDF